MQNDMFDLSRRLYGEPVNTYAPSVDGHPPAEEMLRGRMQDPRRVKDFALAGCAHLTVRSAQTQARFTYRVRAPHHATELERQMWQRRPIWFVAVLTGPDNQHHYEYIGQIYSSLTFVHGKKSRIAKTALSVQAFEWFWQVVRLERVDLFSRVEVWHEGRCGRCGRKLTVPESVETGFGPDCIEMVRAGGAR